MIIQWAKFRRALEEKNLTREAVIKQAFKEYIAGNDSFEDKSTAEMEDYFSTFRSAWILAEMFVR